MFCTETTHYTFISVISWSKCMKRNNDTPLSQPKMYHSMYQYLWIIGRDLYVHTVYIYINSYADALECTQSSVCLKVTLTKNEQPVLCLWDKEEDKKRESAEEGKRRERLRESERERQREGSACDKTEDGLKSFKLFFPLNNPSFVQI